MSNDKQLMSQLVTAGRTWAAAKAECASAVSLDSDSFRAVSKRTGAVQEDMENNIARLVKEARTRGILGEVIRSLQSGNEQATLYLVNHFVDP
jgi:hypothetical protein